MRKQLLLAISLLVVVASCGGGGNPGGASSVLPSTNPVTQPLKITNANFPDGVQGDPYSMTLTASGGTKPYSFQITPALPQGLTLDSATGIISGTPSDSSYNSYTFTAVDANGASVTSQTYLRINPPLTVGPSGVSHVQQWNSPQVGFFASGGIAPYQYTGSGNLPPGLRLSSDGSLAGVPISTGTYTFSVNVIDSHVPADTATTSLTMMVDALQLSLANSLPTRILANRPFTGTLVANGGTPPYSFSINAGTFPAGLTLDPATGAITGTPTTVTTYSFNTVATDSSSPAQMTSEFFNIAIVLPRGRNDSPNNAAPVGNGAFAASLSPFSDLPKVSTPDTDYYKLLATAGSTVHVETFAKRQNPANPIDTMVEITDLNGVQLSTGCNKPGSTANNFNDKCFDDDISASPHVQDSALDYKVPSTNPTQTFLVHVLDWSGNARPDMTYQLQVSGVEDPLLPNFHALNDAVTGASYNDGVIFTGGVQPVTFSILSGSLPPGLTFTPQPQFENAVFGGTATTPGTYAFTVQAVDSAIVPQVVTQAYSIKVIAALLLTSPFNLPAASVGNPYSYTFSFSGGVPPYRWQYLGGNLPPDARLDPLTGTLTFIPSTAATYGLSIAVTDSGHPQQYQSSFFNLAAQ